MARTCLCECARGRERKKNPRSKFTCSNDGSDDAFAGTFWMLAYWTKLLFVFFFLLLRFWLPLLLWLLLRSVDNVIWSFSCQCTWMRCQRDMRLQKTYIFRCWAEYIKLSGLCTAATTPHSLHWHERETNRRILMCALARVYPNMLYMLSWICIFKNVILMVVSRTRHFREWEKSAHRQIHEKKKRFCKFVLIIFFLFLFLCIGQTGKWSSRKLMNRNIWDASLSRQWYGFLVRWFVFWFYRDTVKRSEVKKEKIVNLVRVQWFLRVCFILLASLIRFTAMPRAKIHWTFGRIIFFVYVLSGRRVLLLHLLLLLLPPLLHLSLFSVALCSVHIQFDFSFWWCCVWSSLLRLTHT